MPPYPSISVLIANYNHGRYLGDALERLFAQSVAPSQVIVVDDASTDAIVALVRASMAQWPQVRLLINSKNLGMIPAARRGLGCATGDYLFWPGADDYSLPGLLEETLSIATKHPGAGLVFWDASTVDERTGHINDNPVFLSSSPVYFSPADFCELLRRGRLPCLGGANAVYRRAAYDNVGGLFEESAFFVDGFASISVALRYGACYLPRTLTRARILPTSYMLSGRKRDPITPVTAALERWNSTEFSDIRPLIRRSGFAGWLMGNFGVKLFLRLISDADLRFFITPLAIKRMLWYWGKNGVASHTPHVIKPFYQQLRNRYRSARTHRTSEGRVPCAEPRAESTGTSDN
ncbi:MAG TPA: glycosyltransferase family A protein [Nitrospira sp.]|nr:glycosyltransferase family A protein [Nitrospira sp.]